MEIINGDFKLDIYGFSGIAVNKDYTGIAFQLMGKMWQAVKSNDLKNKGLNVFVYDRNERVFAGVELNEIPNPGIGLQLERLALTKYAYYNHVGPYGLIKQAGQNMRDELENKGYDVSFPYIEIYGHWVSDESKLETELLLSVK